MLPIHFAKLDVHELREHLQELDAVLLSSPKWRIGTSWWTRGWARRRELRTLINLKSRKGA